MTINVSVQYNGGLPPDIILVTQCYYNRGTRLNAMNRFCICSLRSHLKVLTFFPLDWGMLRLQPIMRTEDRLFDRGWVRSAMATRKCGNIYFRKYFMAVRKFTNIFVLLLTLMVGSRDTLFLVCFT